MDIINKESLYGKLDFNSIEKDTDFKEDSVREVIILPLIKQLGYLQENIIRSKTLQHPFVNIGSKKRKINLIPVFAHKDPEFWHLIVETAEKCRFEYVGAVAQKNGQTSFKKRQNPFTVLSG